MKRLLWLFTFLSIATITLSQKTSISDDPLHTADPSAVLDVQSTTKGLLVPRMTSVDRSNIGTPAVGLMVFDLDSKSFWCYAGSKWIEIRSGAVTMISDQDGDTRIEVEKNPDEDAIRFVADSAEIWKMTKSRIYLPNPDDNILIGHKIGEESATGLRNIGIGGSALQGVSGDENTNIGYAAGVFSISGARNTSIGAFSLRGMRTGHHNVAVGARSMDTERYGWGNVALGANTLVKGNNRSYLVAVGDSTLHNNGGFSPGALEGQANTAVGGRSMVKNIQGSYNTALGYTSLYHNEDGSSNVGIGSGALYLNTSGEENIAIGRHSMYANETGDENLAIGFQSLYNNTMGNRNVAIGEQAGFINNSGSSNVFVGADAGWASTSGSRNVFVGDSAGYNNLASDNIYIGYHAGSTSNISNRLYLENSDSQTPLIYGEFDNDVLGFNAKVGIGTQSPSTHLHIDKSTDASLSAHGLLVLGPITNENTVIDANEMQARNNGAAEDLNFNIEGGDINFGSSVVEQEFEFRGGDVLMSSLGSTDLDRGIKWGESNSGGVFGFIYDGQGAGDENRLHLREYLGTTEDIMTIKGNGNIGIHAPNPVEKLHIHESSPNPFPGDALMKFTNATTSVLATDGFDVGIENFGDGIVWQREDKDLKFGTDNSLRMIIDNDGQVGIGTAEAVDSKIHIHKSDVNDIPAKIRFTDHVTGVGSPITVAGFEVGLTTDQRGALYHQSYKDIVFISRSDPNFNNFSTKMTLQPDGDVVVHDRLGVGAAPSQGATLQIDSNTGATEDPLRVRLGTSTKLMVHDNGAVSLGTSTKPTTNNIYISSRLGIGDSSPDVELDVVGSITYTGSITNISDVRLKEEIEQIEDATNIISQLRGVRYNLKSSTYPELNLPKSRQIGVIAQEVEAVLPELVLETGEGFKSVDYAKLSAVLIEAVKEQQKQIDQLERILLKMVEEK